MLIIIDKENRINVTSSGFALMKLSSTGTGKPKEWSEYEWFSKLETAICALGQKHLASEKKNVKLVEFLKEYKDVKEEIQALVKT